MADAIDLRRCAILGGPAVYDWPVSAVIEGLDLDGQGISVNYVADTARGPWARKGPPGAEPAPVATLWVVLSIASSWWAAPILELPAVDHAVGVDFRRLVSSCLADGSKFTPMTGHDPKPGEMVGFFLTAGVLGTAVKSTARQARSNIVVVEWPDKETGDCYAWVVPDPPAEFPTPEPEPEPPLDVTRPQAHTTVVEVEAVRFQAACSAMAGILAAIAHETVYDPAVVASDAVELADALLARLRA